MKKEFWTIVGILVTLGLAGFGGWVDLRLQVNENQTKIEGIKTNMSKNEWRIWNLENPDKKEAPQGPPGAAAATKDRRTPARQSLAKTQG